MNGPLTLNDGQRHPMSLTAISLGVGGRGLLGWVGIIMSPERRVIQLKHLVKFSEANVTAEQLIRKLFTIQDRQYCQLYFSCAIRNELNQ